MLAKTLVRFFLAPFAVVLACSREQSSEPGPLPATSPSALLKTLSELAAFGEKRAGTVGGKLAGDYLSRRFQELGFKVSLEEFHFPRWDLVSSSFSVSLAGGGSFDPGYDVFEGSGGGLAIGEIVDVGVARPKDFEGKEVRGKICLVRRDPSYHRTVQVDNVTSRGGTAVIYRSSAPDNLRQVGTVRKNWEAMTQIPVVTLGADDGDRLAAQISENVTAVLQVEVTSTPGTARNIVARFEGTDPAAAELVIGAHYDTWFTGSTDNGGGVAALLALAERRALRGPSRAPLLFVAYDAEEIGLYGGYEFLRRHLVLAKEPIAAVLHFEIPAAIDRTSQIFAYSAVARFKDIFREAALDELYRGYLEMGLIPAFQGGTIPTDIRGIYRSGIPTAFASVGSPYYHTSADTPDKVDVEFLAQATDRFDDAVTRLLEAGPTCCDAPDEDLYRGKPVLTRSASDEVVLDLDVMDSKGVSQVGAAIEATLLYDDFFRAEAVIGMSDATGHAKITFSQSATSLLRGKSFVHVTAGRDYPLMERVLAVP